MKKRDSRASGTDASFPVDNRHFSIDNAGERFIDTLDPHAHVMHALPVLLQKTGHSPRLVERGDQLDLRLPWQVQESDLDSLGRDFFPQTYACAEKLDVPGARCIEVVYRNGDMVDLSGRQNAHSGSLDA
jgi:hypothetical protein